MYFDTLLSYFIEREKRGKERERETERGRERKRVRENVFCIDYAFSRFFFF